MGDFQPISKYFQILFQTQHEKLWKSAMFYSLKIKLFLHNKPPTHNILRNGEAVNSVGLKTSELISSSISLSVQSFFYYPTPLLHSAAYVPSPHPRTMSFFVHGGPPVHKHMHI